MSDQAGIESDLARTRARMDERLSELQARLTPKRIAEDVMGYVSSPGCKSWSEGRSRPARGVSRAAGRSRSPVRLSRPGDHSAIAP